MQVQASQYPLCVSFQSVDLKDHHLAEDGYVIHNVAEFALVRRGRGYVVRNLDEDRNRCWCLVHCLSFHTTLLGGMAGLARAHQGLEVPT